VEGSGPTAEKARGMVIVFTGSGKGKTTAALGIALRACGHALRTLVIQFIKGPWLAGELEAAKRLAPNLEIIATGKGFVGIRGDDRPFSEHQKAAQEALALARDKAGTGAYDILVLDELDNALRLGLVSLEDVLAFLRSRPAAMHVILTGRDAPPELVAAADLVTEMLDVKHPFNEGQVARRGIDF